MAPIAPSKSKATLCPDDFSNCGMSMAIAVAMAEPERILICAALAAFTVAMNNTEEIAAATAADDVLIMISSTVDDKFLPSIHSSTRAERSDGKDKPRLL